ncbi:MAG: hypothetical protein AAB209_12610 [Bacteroidota bacterium]
MALFILAVIVFVIADILLRYALSSWKERKIRKEREDALRTSLVLEPEEDGSAQVTSIQATEIRYPKSVT